MSIAVFSATTNAAGLQESSDDLPIDFLQILELPVNVINPSISKGDKRYLMKCEVANTTGHQLRGITFLIMVLNQANQVHTIASRTEAVRLDGYSSKHVTVHLPRQWKITTGDRLVMVVEQVMTRRWIWTVFNSEDALSAFAKGGAFVNPQVKRLLNQVDSKPLPQTIY